jgi:Leucine-rich repeat (LRR) protein
MMIDLKKEFTEIPENLPKDAEKIIFGDHQNIEKIEHIEHMDKLRELEIPASNLRSFDGGLPKNLKSIIIHRNFGKGIGMLGALPDNLEVLQLRRCGISGITKFPKKIGVADLRDNKITSLPPFPNKIGFIDISGSPIERLYDIPKSLKSIKMHSCAVTTYEWIPKHVKSIVLDNNPINVDIRRWYHKAQRELELEYEAKMKKPDSVTENTNIKSNNKQNNTIMKHVKLFEAFTSTINESYVSRQKKDLKDFKKNNAGISDKVWKNFLQNMSEQSDEIRDYYGEGMEREEYDMDEYSDLGMALIAIEGYGFDVTDYTDETFKKVAEYDYRDFIDELGIRGLDAEVDPDGWY